MSYWDDVDEAWAARAARPIPVRDGPRAAGLAAAMLLGLRDALEPVDRSDPIVEEVPAEPEDPSARVVVRLDPVPRRSIALLRSG